MPTYSPSQSPPSPLLELSPNSFRDFRKREEKRFNFFQDKFQEEIDFQENEFSDEEFLEEAAEEGPHGALSKLGDFWNQCSEEEEICDFFLSPEEDKQDDGNLMSHYDNDNDNDDLIFQIDPVHLETSQVAKKRSKKGKLCVGPPFWYLYESSDHLSVIVQQYSHKLLKDNTPSTQCDYRRLPKFIGRIQRSPVLNNNNNNGDMDKKLCGESRSEALSEEFHTFDRVDVYQRDVRPCGSYTTKLSTSYVISSWDKDGIPKIIEILENCDQISMWRRKIIKKYPVSYIYSLPVFQSKTEFKYSVEREEHEVGYACQPWNYTPYLPPEFLKRNTIDCSEEEYS